jgi:hypothetical protein
LRISFTRDRLAIMDGNPSVVGSLDIDDGLLATVLSIAKDG